MTMMVARFMKEYAEQMRGNDMVRADVLYEAYGEYMCRNGYEKETKKSIGFGMIISKYKGMYREHGRNGTTYRINKGEIVQYLSDKYKI